MTHNTVNFSLTPDDNHRLMLLCGQHDENLKFIEKRLIVEIKNRGTDFTITGKKEAIQSAKNILQKLFQFTQPNKLVTLEEIHLMLHADKHQHEDNGYSIHTPSGLIKARSKNQHIYIENISKHDINFSIGPAGTGKTYLAVACAVHALEQDWVSRILLVRPAVEAGEKLGFLPGDMAQKVDPYLRPLYDALYEMLGFDRVGKLLEKQVIEIAPLAYMRGRTLNNSFVILDESQNTTMEQMKMFLTRIGFGSKAIITGDITQIDLDKNKKSGLLHVMDVLKNIEGISFTFFNSKDVVRHPLVQNIIEAYAAYEK